MQFVDFASVKAETAAEGPSRRDAMFALRSLMEIPDQFKVRPTAGHLAAKANARLFPQ